MQGLLNQFLPKPVPAAMSDEDKRTIYRFALMMNLQAEGAAKLRQDAIEAHHRNIPLIGVRGNVYQRFMAEIDNSAPDLNLRHRYRAEVKLEHEVGAQ